jgi:hypothetical protein
MQNTLDHCHTALTETLRLMGMCHEWVLQEDVDGVRGRCFMDNVARLRLDVEKPVPETFRELFLASFMVVVERVLRIFPFHVFTYVFPWSFSFVMP